ncbi:MAG: hypothetical protein M1474_03080 [Candidatus Marsarchaeota archaeon]|jgi:hypothetical protein|nr:hypothetical protein [Candidatus Marsarchaeota archaeon]
MANMNKKVVRRGIAILMGLIILVADLYWTYIAFHAAAVTPEMLGIIIFVADIIWLVFDARS